MVVHTAGPDDRCVVCGEPFPCPTAEAIYDQVVTRQLDPNPRCASCTSPDPNGRPPMFHPEHRWGPCDVRLPGGEPCGCTVGVAVSPPTA